MMNIKISPDCKINQHFSCTGMVSESGHGETVHYECACRCHTKSRELVAA